jgi:hypothetical protein
VRTTVSSYSRSSEIRAPGRPRVGGVAFEKAGTPRITVRADPARARDAPASARAANAIENRIRLSERIGQFMNQPTERGARGGPLG